jgi:hypothetical protein
MAMVTKRMLRRRAALGLALACALAPVAAAHDPHDWIRRGGYKGVDGTSCCGKDDCDEIPPARLRQSPGGYRLLDFGIDVPYSQAMRSEDGRYWLCRSDAKTMRCFFAPPPQM